VAEVIAQQRREESLERLEALVRRANELRASLNALLNAIESKYSSDPRLGSLLQNVLKAVRPPDISSEQLLSVSSSLERYVEELERSVKILTEYVVVLDKLQEALSALEGELEELEAWCELLRDLAPHLAAEAAKVAASISRYTAQPPLEDLKRAYSEAELLLREAKRCSRVCRTAYVNRVNELLAVAQQLAKTAKRVHASLALTDASAILAIEDSLRALISQLSEASSKPLKARLNLLQVKSELDAIEQKLSSLSEHVPAEGDAKLVRELERIAIALEGRTIALSNLLEILAKRTGLPLDAILRQLVLLEKKGLASIQVKLSV